MIRSKTQVEVAPVGAWIEILGSCSVFFGFFEVAPVGAWIEILGSCSGFFGFFEVAPVGAWIEIKVTEKVREDLSKSPLLGRGLK